MSFDINRLYKLLPAVYRIRDQAAQGAVPGAEDEGALYALMSVIAGQLAVLEENFDQLYDDQFIETCAEWVVPYIGDLVGTRGLVSFPDAPFSQRGQVAKTIAYRRRKGTAAVLEDLAFDVTGWKANVVEYFQLLATTQYLNHRRPGNLSVAPIRGRALLEYANTPFDVLTHSVDVRRIGSGRGKYNIPNLGIFLWRIQDYSCEGAPAFQVDALRYRFDVLGKDIALYNRPVTEVDITHLAGPVNVPMPLRRYPFSQSRDTWYGKDKSVLIVLDGVAVAVEDICICDLSDAGSGPDWRNMPVGKIAIDPKLGRIALPAGHAPVARVTVDYSYGFSADIGGGNYDKEESFTPGLKPVIQVPAHAATIEDALDMLGTGGGVVEITGSDYYAAPLTTEVPAAVKIEIRATEESRPVFIISGEWSITGGQDAELSLNGLLCCGGVIHVPGKTGSGALNLLQTVEITNCTLVPGLTPFDTGGMASNPRLIAEAENLKVTVSKSIIGGMRVADVATAVITDSILDGGDKTIPAYTGVPDAAAGGALSIENSTVIGGVKTSVMTLASNTIFYASMGAGGDDLPVEAVRLQEGCVRFCYLPAGSRVPKPYHCQPATVQDEERVTPVFNSLRYGDGDYCQLSQYCAVEIRQGAENDMEMGVFYHLYQPLCEINLRTRLDEYLRFGLEAGFFYGS